MAKKAVLGIVVFVLLSIVVIGAVSASPSRQRSETGPLGFLIAVLNDASDKGTLTDTLSTLLSDLLIEHLITPNTGETPAQVRARLTTTSTPIPINPPRPAARELGIINIALTSMLPGNQVGLGSAQLSDYMHYWGVGEVTMKFVPPGVVASMLAESWELDFNAGDSLPYGATLKIRDDVIFHGQGLGDRSNNGGGWGPMTAHDIAFTINDGNGSVNRASIHWQAGDFATVFGDNPAVAVDDRTLKVTFATDHEGQTIYDPRSGAPTS